jgi:DNA-binding winged helix-turn-helix (wHTH) protein/tetratricopeptide (TPR) repeat protein
LLPTGPVVYVFGEFRLDPAARRLQRGAEEVELPRRVFDCLLCLLECRTRAVGRDELISHVWGRDNVSDNQLAQTVLIARRMLDDDAATKRLIRTVPGFGYQWVGEVVAEDVRPICDSGTLVTSSSAKPTAPGVRLPAVGQSRLTERRWPWVVGVASILVAIFGSMAWLRLPPRAPAPAELPAESPIMRSRVWVFPATVVDEPEAAWARVGLMAQIAERMRRGGFTVVPLESVLAHVTASGGRDLDPQRIETAGGRDQVIRSAARRERGQWTVTLSADNPRLAVDGRHEDLMTAARLASDALVFRLGGTAGRVPDWSNERLEIIRLAIGAHDFDGARVQLDRLPLSEREGPGAGAVEAELELRIGQPRQALSRLNRFLDEPDQLSPELHGQLLLNRAASLRRLGDPDWSSDIDIAVAILETAQAPRSLAVALRARGIREAIADRYSEASADFLRARRLFQEAGDDLGAASIHANLAQVSIMVGRPTDALDQLARSADAYKGYGAVGNEFNAVSLMVGVQTTMLRWQDALDSSERARKLLPYIADAAARSLHLRRRAIVMTHQGRLAEAAILLDELDREVRRGDLGDHTLAMDGLYRAELLLARGQAAEAAEQAASSFAAYYERNPVSHAGSMNITDARDYALVLWLRAMQQVRTGHVGNAELPLTAEQRAVIDHPERIYARIARGRWLTAAGRLEEAGELFRRALIDAEESNRMSRVLHATSHLISLLLVEQRVTEADALLDRFYARDPDLLERDYETALLTLRVRHAQASHESWQVARDHALALAGERQVPEVLLRAP